MKSISLLFFCLLGYFSAYCQTTNYAEHIAPIIYKHCTSCHRTGEIGPFPLTNYQEVVANAEMIAQVTASKQMPPWKADPGYRRFQNENYLSAEEIRLISEWYKSGSPQGDPTKEPELPVFSQGSQLGVPDKVLSFKQAYLHKGNNVDEYRYFVLPTGLAEDKDLVALEVRPGNVAIVHHTLVWADTTGQAAKDDAKTPEYGYESPANSVFSSIDGQLPGYVPGQRPHLFAYEMGQRLKKGSDLKLQMHYAPTASDEWDSTAVNLYFAKKPVKRYLKSKVMLPFGTVLTNGPFVIPANTTREFHGVYTFTENVSMLGISPHMHKLGKHWKVYAVKPNKDTVNLISIKDWDFNWQGTYHFTSPIILPKGTIVHAYAKYDNTTSNIFNPFSPPQMVTWGEGTSAEMYYLPLTWVSYQPGDENIVFDSGSTAVSDPEKWIIGTTLYPLSPNPSNGNARISFSLATDTRISLAICNSVGEPIRIPIKNRLYEQGLHYLDCDLSNEPNGHYFVTLQAHGRTFTEKLLIQK